MEIKLFGKELFGFKKNGYNSITRFLDEVDKENENLKTLPDFSVVNHNESYGIIEYVAAPDDPKTAKAKKEKEAEIKKLSPKNVFEANMLNSEGFKINVKPEYVDGQIADFTQKLELLRDSDKDFRNGHKEINSILIRMRNRKQYAEFKEFYEKYAYTTTTMINSLVKKHDYLKLGSFEQFIADMPKEAIKEMEAYNKHTKKLCEKNAVFYIIADKKDFKKSDERRDPILLAQSPFGHFWQVLGAWDEEMLFLEEL